MMSNSEFTPIRLPDPDTNHADRHQLYRAPQCLEWQEMARQTVATDISALSCEISEKVSSRRVIAPMV
jgi:hypothetical protein